MQLRTPIVYLTLEGEIAKTNSTISHPFLEVEIISQAKKQTAPWLRTYALVDTGATNGFLSHSLIEMLQVQKTGSTQLTGNMGKHHSDTYETIWRTSKCGNIGVPIICTAMAQAFDFPHSQALVGMSLLRLGRLHLEGPTGNSFFEFLPDRIGK